MLARTVLCVLLLSPLIAGESTGTTSTQPNDEDGLTDVTVSFGIKSFTVEVNKPTDKPLNVSEDVEGIRSKDDSGKFEEQHLDRLVIPDNVERFYTTELPPSTEFNDNEMTTVTTEPRKLEFSERINNDFEKIDNVQNYNTDERPPASVSISPSATMISSSPAQTNVDTAHVHMMNDFHIERKLENGLYRIKLAEIITDEFNGGDSTFESANGGDRNQHQTPSAVGKINIIDLYPSKLEDFVPLIEETHTVTTKHMDDDSNSLSNSLNSIFERQRRLSNSNEKLDFTNGDEENSRKATEGFEKITDITGKLQQQDGVITEIEKKFRLDELKQSTPKSLTVNQKIDFIDRRVKKSFQPPQTPYGPSSSLGRVDFANTKFNTDSTKRNEFKGRAEQDHPAFSTTKFYNSKELYNEMLHKKLTDILGASDGRIATMPEPLTTEIPSTSYSGAPVRESATGVTKSNAVESPGEHSILAAPTYSDSYLSREDVVSTTAHTTPGPLRKTKVLPKSTTLSINVSAAAERATSEVAGILETSPSVSATSSFSGVKQEFTTPRQVPEKQGIKVPANVNVPEMSTPGQTTSSGTASAAKLAKYSTKTPLLTPNTPPEFKARKPFSRPRVLTRLQEKINSLECDIQNLPQDSHIWRGNETHELLLPSTGPEKCFMEDCLPMIISWEGQAEIQSGDVLIVEINDAMLTPADLSRDQNNNTHKATTRVYQVTRPGHEHCDVTEGVLLDITPLVVDGRKLVTLYDKDLTEGINLLIVVSELWGSQCVRLRVTMKSDNCGENADCSGKGVCFSNASMEGYECQCCSGFAGPHCEEIDACSPSPCTNNGICVDLSQGHEGNAYQCLCPYGYTGKNCQYESDPCNPAECMNGGSCVGNSTHFRCDCAPGYTGPLCQHNLNECESSPCVHGICVDQEDGFRCFCQPGFAGELCNFEYNECESNPCLNGGECIDQIGSFECKCTKGYTGNQCHIKVDFCANKPCREGHRCIDHGDDFTCECPGGRNGPDCNQVPRTLCNVNPCANGGTCWTSEDSFYCACRPGYTGKMCEDEFVVETVVSSSEFMVDDANAGGSFGDKAFGSAVSKSPIELHNAYIAAGTLAAAIFIVAVVVTICHCKVHQTYRRFSTRHHQLIPIFGFGKRIKSPKSHRHWLSGKGGGGGGGGGGGSTVPAPKVNKGHLPGTGTTQCHNHHLGGSAFHHQHPPPLQERPFQRHLAMNLENDMYYTVDFSESQHSPLIQ